MFWQTHFAGKNLVNVAGCEIHCLSMQSPRRSYAKNAAAVASGSHVHPGPLAGSNVLWIMLLAIVLAIWKDSVLYSNC